MCPKQQTDVRFLLQNEMMFLKTLLMLPWKYGLWIGNLLAVYLLFGRSDKAEQMLLLLLLEWNNSREIWKAVMEF